MRAFRMVSKACMLALLLVATAGSEGRAAMADDVTLSLGSAETCLAEVGRLRGTPVFAEWELGGFMRKLANDIDYARTWAARDDARALSRLGDDSCSARLAHWTKADPAGAPVADASGGMEGDGTASPRTSDLEYYLRSRQAAIAAIARIQANPRAAMTSYRRPAGY